MASIHKKFKKDGTPVYYVYYRVGTKQICKRAGTTAREARDLKATIEYELFRGLYLEPSRMFFKELASKYLEHIQAKNDPNTHKQYETFMRLYILPHFQDYRINKITQQICDMFIVTLAADGTTKQNINQSLRRLKGIFNFAKKKSYLLVNPADNVEPPKYTPKESEIYTLDEMLQLLRAIGDDFFRAFVATACLQALRASEISGLCWKDIDFENAVIHVRRQYQSGNGYLDTKTGVARSLPMSRKYMEILKKHRDNLKHPPGDDEPVFSLKEGKPFTSYQNRFKKAAEQAGLKKIKFHGLRHSCCSAWIASGIPEPIAQKMMGHKTPGMTRHYTHLRDEMMLSAMEKYNRLTESTSGVEDEEKLS